MTHHLQRIAASGGQATYEKYGAAFMSLIAKKRWAKDKANKKFLEMLEREEESGSRD